MCVHVCAMCTVCVVWGGTDGEQGQEMGDHAKRRSAWGSGGPGLLRALGGGLWAVVMGPSLAALSPPPAFDYMMTTGPFLPPCWPVCTRHVTAHRIFPPLCKVPDTRPGDAVVSNSETASGRGGPQEDVSWKPTVSPTRNAAHHPKDNTLPWQQH